MKKDEHSASKSNFRIYLFAFILIALLASVIIMPQAALEAAKDGLSVWLNVVFPALLPFFIICELMIGSGIVNFIGTLLEPLMRPLFNVPGAGAFAFAMGLCSGYPTGAKITSRLARDGLCTQAEAERLVAFTSTSNPIFMMGAVAVGMYKMPALGPIIVCSHYLGAIAVGLIMRFYKRNEPSSQIRESEPLQKNRFRKALDELISAETKNKKPVGQLLGDAVKDSMKSIITVGGFIIFFSVIVGVIKAVGIADIFAWIMSVFRVPKDISSAVINGIFEMSIGAKAVSLTSQTLSVKVILTTAILGFGGLSIAGQVSTMTLGTNIKMKPYFIARSLHAVISSIIAWALLNFTPIRNKIFMGASTIIDKVRSLSFFETLKISTFSIIVALTLIMISVILSVIFNKRKR